MANNSPLSSGNVTLTKTTSGVQTLLPPVNHARMIVSIVCEATEDYTYGTGSKATWSLGETGAPTRWDSIDGVRGIPENDATAGTNTTDSPALSDSALGAAGCILAANKAIIVTPTPAVGDGTGGCKIVVVAVDAP